MVLLFIFFQLSKISLFFFKYLIYPTFKFVNLTTHRFLFTELINQDRLSSLLNQLNISRLLCARCCWFAIWWRGFKKTRKWLFSNYFLSCIISALLSFLHYSSICIKLIFWHFFNFSKRIVDLILRTIFFIWRSSKIINMLFIKSFH